MAAAPEDTGIVIAAHGRHYLVEAGGTKRNCVTRGKKSDVAVGDRVHFKPTSADQGVIESIAERKTLLYRSDQYRAKLLAANVTQLLVVVATEPGFSDDLISRALVAAEAAGIDARIVLNKTDIDSALPAARRRLALYAGLGYPVHE
ncbi:MAG: GTPase RsgA, partial [Burkholderiaceae bacterium]